MMVRASWRKELNGRHKKMKKGLKKIGIYRGSQRGGLILYVCWLYTHIYTYINNDTVLPHTCNHVCVPVLVREREALSLSPERTVAVRSLCPFHSPYYIEKWYYSPLTMWWRPCENNSKASRTQW